MIDPNRYTILVEGGPPSNYSCFSPDVPGCVATGDTLDECVASMREALRFHLEWMERDGDPIPEPSGAGGVYLDIQSLAAA